MSLPALLVSTCRAWWINPQSWLCKFSNVILVSSSHKWTLCHDSFQTADPINGFNAHVQKIPAIVSAPAKIIAQPAIVQPAKIIAPVPTYRTYVAPTKLIAAAPFVSHAKYFSSPIVAAPYTYHHSPYLASYHHAPTSAYFAHAYAPSAAAIIQH